MWTFELDNPTLQIWRQSFPDVNIIQELGLMGEWLSRHPKRRGTKRFAANWLKAEQRKASERRKEIDVGRGPSSDVPTVSLVRPEVLERIRAREEKRKSDENIKIR